MDLWIKILLVALFGILIYREILKSLHNPHKRPLQKSKAGFMSFVTITLLIGVFTYAGIFVTKIETRDLRPFTPSNFPQMVSIYDPGVIELEGMVIKTNLAHQGELTALATQLTSACVGDKGCELQSLFDYVTNIPYRTDHTSRNAKKVIETNWGDCDDKSNLFASLLNERGFDYRFVYVPRHVFVVVHTEDSDNLPFLPASLQIEGKKFYYAETTAKNSKIGEFNGQFPHSFEGIYDIKKDEAVDHETVSFSFG